MANTIFGLTGRDKFKRAYNGTGNSGTPTSLDAGFLTIAQSAISAIESFSINGVVLENTSARSTGLSTTIQRWSYVYDGVTTYGGTLVTPYFLLRLSPVVLEDSGIISTQNSTPAQAKTSLVSSLFLSVPRYTPGSAVTLSANGFIIPSNQPSWVESITKIPLLRFSIRNTSLTGAQIVEARDPVFFDAGDGVSPYILLPVQYGAPSLFGTAVPSGTYEICILAASWIA